MKLMTKIILYPSCISLIYLEKMRSSITRKGECLPVHTGTEKKVSLMLLKCHFSLLFSKYMLPIQIWLQNVLRFCQTHKY